MRKLLSLLSIVVLFISSCEDDTVKSDKKEIVSFQITGQVDSTKIDSEKLEVNIVVPSNTDLTAIKPSITVSEKATISPESGSAVDFSSGSASFTVTAEDNSVKTWKVYVTKEAIKEIIKDNLDGINITSIVIDSNNSLWIGTDSGLFRSIDNKYKLENSVITGKVISLGYEPTSNILWVGTENGLTKCTINNGTLSGSGIDAANLSSPKVYSFCKDARSIRWFGTALGPTMNKENTWKKNNFQVNALDEYINIEFANFQVNAIATWDGDVYFATSGKTIYRAYGYNESLDAFTGASQLGSPYNGPNISDTMNAVFVDSQNRIWMAGNNGLQFIVGHETKSPDIFGFGLDYLPSIRIHAIAEGKDGKLWVGTENGLAILENETWTTKTTGLPNLFVTAIAFDNYGVAWVGTKKGLAKL